MRLAFALFAYYRSLLRYSSSFIVPFSILFPRQHGTWLIGTLDPRRVTRITLLRRINRGLAASVARSRSRGSGDARIQSEFPVHGTVQPSERTSQPALAFQQTSTATSRLQMLQSRSVSFYKQVDAVSRRPCRVRAREKAGERREVEDVVGIAMSAVFTDPPTHCARFPPCNAISSDAVRRGEFISRIARWPFRRHSPKEISISETRSARRDIAIYDKGTTLAR